MTRPQCGIPVYSIAVVLAGAIIELTLGSIFSHGNIALYIVSYTRARSLDPYRDYVTLNVSPWLYGSVIMALSSSVVLGGWMVKAMGTRPTALVGCLVFSGSVLLTAGAVKLSFWAVVATYGVMMGFGMGLTYTAPLYAVAQWLPGHMGVAMGVVLAGMGAAPLLFNPLQTAYVNPLNLLPDCQPNPALSFAYFTQSELLDRVPIVFLLEGLLCLALQLTSVALLVEPREDRSFSLPPRVCCRDSVVCLWHTIQPQSLDLCSQERRARPRDPASGTLLPSSSADEEEVISDPDNLWRKEKLKLDRISRRSSGRSVVNVKPSELWRRWDFYLLWLAFAMLGDAKVFVVSMYKTFGIQFRYPDHSLAFVGSMAALANCFGRVLFGLLAQYVPCKVVLMIIYGCAAILLFTWYGTPDVGFSLYVVWILLMYFCFGGVYSVFPMCAALWFGPDHLSTNYSILYTSQLLAGVTAILVSTLGHHHLGWVGQVYIAGGLCLVGLVLVIVAGNRTVARNKTT